MALAEFCCNRDLESVSAIHIGMTNVSRETICQRCTMFGFPYEQTDDEIVTVMFGKPIHIIIYERERKQYLTGGIYGEWVRCSDERAAELRNKNPYMTAAGMWRVPYSQTFPAEYYLPYCPGFVLDQIVPGWFQTIKHRPFSWGINDHFFDEARAKNGVELLAQLYECGRKAKIDHAMFIGFGTLLGAIRHGGFIPNDRDMDMCILADRISVDAALAYIEACQAAGLGEHRWRAPEFRADTGMPLWFSLGPKNPVSESGVKCCQWFWFKHGGYWWHSKGAQWISPSKFNPHKVAYTQSDAAIAKGIPEGCVNRLVEHNFLGLPVLVPSTAGRCLDEWYPGWPVPREGASAHTYHLVVGNWHDERTWRVS